MTVIYTLMAWTLAARARDARLVPALPIIGNIAVSLCYTLDFVDYRAWEPPSRTMIAIGAEFGLWPLIVGAVASTTMSLALAASRRFVEVRQRRSATGSVVLALGLGLVIGYAGYTWRLFGDSHQLFSPVLRVVARTLLGGAVIVFVGAVAACFGPTQTTGRTASPRLWFLTFAFISGAIACGLEAVIRILWSMAPG